MQGYYDRFRELELRDNFYNFRNYDWAANPDMAELEQLQTDLLGDVKNAMDQINEQVKGLVGDDGQRDRNEVLADGEWRSYAEFFNKSSRFLDDLEAMEKVLNAKYTELALGLDALHLAPQRTPSQYQVRRPPPPPGGGMMQGIGMPEGNSIFKRAADEAYKSNPSRNLDGYELFASSPTLKFWKKGNEVIVGIRGTVLTDFQDIKADASIAAGRLEWSNRFKKDLAYMMSIRSQYPGEIFYGAGHSLGGAILDLFISKNLIRSGKSINAATQLGKDESKNERIYNSGDALYALSKPFLKDAPVVEEKEKSLLAKVSPLYNLYEQHGISGAGKVGDGSTQYALTEDDIRKLVGNVPIYRYPDLLKFKTPEEMFKGQKAAVLLFLTDNRNSGHWLVVLNQPGNYEVFDSFGVSMSLIWVLRSDIRKS